MLRRFPTALTECRSRFPNHCFRLARGSSADEVFKIVFDTPTTRIVATTRLVAMPYET
jgi:hypothetical protein